VGSPAHAVRAGSPRRRPGRLAGRACPQAAPRGSHARAAQSASAPQSRDQPHRPLPAGMEAGCRPPRGPCQGARLRGPRAAGNAACGHMSRIGIPHWGRAGLAAPCACENACPSQRHAANGAPAAQVSGAGRSSRPRDCRAPAQGCAAAHLCRDGRPGREGQRRPCARRHGRTCAHELKPAHRFTDFCAGWPGRSRRQAQNRHHGLLPVGTAWQRGAACHFVPTQRPCVTHHGATRHATQRALGPL